ncbi:MAG TPA: hypothetical protein VFA75_22835 [Nevskia sp.]|nr:hypothetical protein [Nevskia sp.]
MKTLPHPYRSLGAGGKEGRIATLVGASLLGLCACGGNNTPPGTGAVRLANGVTDSSGLNASISSVATFSGISLDTGSGLTEVPVGSYNSQLTSSSVQFSVDNVGIDHNNVTTIFAYGVVGSGTQGGFTAEESIVAPTNGQAVVQPVHDARTASAVTPTLSFYLIRPGAGIAGATPVTAAFRASPPSSSIAGGSYEIVVANGTSVVFDSGPMGITLPASSGADVFQIAALDATAAQNTQYGSAIVLLLLDNLGGNTALYNLQN